MKQSKIHQYIPIFIALFWTFFTSNAVAEIQLQSQSLEHRKIGSVEMLVPEGFVLEVLNDKLNRPRMITFAPNGDMLIGSAKTVYHLKPPYVEASNYLSIDGYPHSTAIRDQELFIATTKGIHKTNYDPDVTRIRPLDLTRIAKLPGGFGHSSRTIDIAPDGSVIVSLGITGNCSDEYISDDYSFKDRRGGMLRLIESEDEYSWEPYASGLRNPVGFDFHPITGVMYSANNGPDHWGFDRPPEYFSKVEPNSFHGMPWYQYVDSTLYRDQCIASSPPRPGSDVVAPVATFPARVAPLGMSFVPQNSLGERFDLNAVVALHGSWATQPDGDYIGPSATRRPPAVVMVEFANNEATGSVAPIVLGFQLEDGTRIARPAGIAIGPDNALYFTSDGGAIEGLFRLRRIIQQS